MTNICKGKCKGTKKTGRHDYSLGLHVYCSICSKIFLKEDNPNPHCKCCGCRTRSNPRTRSNRV